MHYLNTVSSSRYYNVRQKKRELIFFGSSSIHHLLMLWCWDRKVKRLYILWWALRTGSLKLWLPLNSLKMNNSNTKCSPWLCPHRRERGVRLSQGARGPLKVYMSCNLTTRSIPMRWHPNQLWQKLNKSALAPPRLRILWTPRVCFSLKWRSMLPQKYGICGEKSPTKLKGAKR